MTPDERQKLYEIYAWMQSRKGQQITYPLDPISENILFTPKLVYSGVGSTALTQTYTVSGGGGGTITGPKAYLGTLVLQDEKTKINYEVPFVSNP